jgi:ribonucleotide reductase beta subunit family protein with ferritin-like domain/glutaredoxin
MSKKYKEIIVYSQQNCPYCKDAKNLLTSWGVPFIMKDIREDAEAFEEFSKINVRSVPQIIIDGKNIGSFHDLVKLSALTMLEAEPESTFTMLDPSISYKPFRYSWAVELTKKHEMSHWVEEELDLSDDVSDWKSNKVTPVEKDYILNVLRLFTQSDVAVGQNYYEYYIPKFKNNEIRNMLGSFAAREGIHQRAYALLNDTLGLPEEEFTSFLEYKEMSDKLDFMTDNDNSTYHNLALSLAKSVFSEGISLFASFVMLLNFQRQGKMKGMCKVVEWSIRDETMHVEGMCALFKQFCLEHPRVVTNELKKEVYRMARQVVDLEEKFLDLAYGDAEEMSDLTKSDVSLYIKHITDRRLLQLGLKPNFGIKDNPIKWLDWLLNGADHTNFFENRVTEYEVAGLVGQWKDVY